MPVSLRGAINEAKEVKKESKQRMKVERKMQPQTRNPRRLEMELNSPETRGAERRRPQEVKPWVSNQNPSPNPSQNQVLNLQLVRNLAKNSLGSRDVKGRQALEVKMGEMKRTGGVLNSQPRRIGRLVPQPVDRLINGQRSMVMVNGQFFQILLHFLVS